MTAKHAYSMQLAYALGDDCKTKISQDTKNEIQWFLAAKLCYLLVEIKHPDNDKGSINSEKLADLDTSHSKVALKVTLKTQIQIPNHVLNLLKLFYARWLPKIKDHLKERSRTRINKREEAFLAVIKRSGLNKLATSSNKSDCLNQHHDVIDQWNGPDFKHLRLANNQRDKNTYYLTVVKNYDGYKKTCCDSQENWSKKYDGKFIANCINRVSQILGSNMALRKQFGKELLVKTVKFENAKPTDLIPNSWLFGGKNCDVLLGAMADLLAVDKTQFAGRGSKQKRKEMMSLCEKQCVNDSIDEDDDMDRSINDDQDTQFTSFSGIDQTTSNIQYTPQVQQINMHNNNVSAIFPAANTSTLRHPNENILAIPVDGNQCTQFTDNNQQKGCNQNCCNNQINLPSFTGPQQNDQQRQYTMYHHTNNNPQIAANYSYPHYDTNPNNVNAANYPQYQQQGNTQFIGDKLLSLCPKQCVEVKEDVNMDMSINDNGDIGNFHPIPVNTPKLINIHNDINIAPVVNTSTLKHGSQCSSAMSVNQLTQTMQPQQINIINDKNDQKSCSENFCNNQLDQPSLSNGIRQNNQPANHQQHYQVMAQQEAQYKIYPHNNDNNNNQNYNTNPNNIHAVNRQHYQQQGIKQEQYGTSGNNNICNENKIYNPQNGLSQTVNNKTWICGDCQNYSTSPFCTFCFYNRNQSQ